MKRLIIGLVALLALVTCANASTIGTANSANCIPWSCQDVYPGNYQQIYNNGDFSGSINIGTISFYNTFDNEGSSQGIANMDFSLYLATTSQSVPDGTLPSGDVLFATGHLDGSNFPFGNTLSFTGSPFLYNPANGNLELTVIVANETGPNSGTITYFDAESGGPFSRYCPACGGNQGYGLVTGFNEASPVPEPTSILLFGAGLSAIGLAAWRRKKA